MSIPKITLIDFMGENVEVIPHFGLYEVKDYMGRPMTMPRISLTTKSEYGEEPFMVLTKSFGEFVGIKNVAYIDTNNCPPAVRFLTLGLAKDTGFTKTSGYCQYPLWQFDEQFLREIGGEEYEKYSKCFDDYMAGAMKEMEDEIEETDVDSGEDEESSFAITM